MGVFYVNGSRWPDLASPGVGWHSAIAIDWRQRSEAMHQLKRDGQWFEAGTPSFLNVYVLANALEHLERLGTKDLE